MKLGGIGIAAMSIGCAAAGPMKRPGAPLVADQPAWPEEVVREAERADRLCGNREVQLIFDYEEGKKEQQGFKTIMGSITGAVGTAAGAVSGVGAYAIHSPDTMKTVTGVTGFIGAGLGAVGSVVTILVSPGATKMKSSQESLTSIDQKREAARAALKGKDPSAWSSEEKEAWAKAAKDLESACK